MPSRPYVCGSTYLRIAMSSKDLHLVYDNKSFSLTSSPEAGVSAEAVSILGACAVTRLTGCWFNNIHTYIYMADDSECVEWHI